MFFKEKFEDCNPRLLTKIPVYIYQKNTGDFESVFSSYQVLDMSINIKWNLPSLRSLQGIGFRFVVTVNGNCGMGVGFGLASTFLWRLTKTVKIVIKDGFYQWIFICLSKIFLILSSCWISYKVVYFYFPYKVWSNIFMDGVVYCVCVSVSSFEQMWRREREKNFLGHKNGQKKMSI